MKALLASVMLLASPALALETEPAPCQNQPDGRVCCDGRSFKVLVDKLVDARRERDLCRVDLGTCQTDLAAAKAPPVSLARPLQPIAAFTLGAVGGALVLLPAVMPNADGTWRLGLSVAGVLSLAGGLAVAAWVQ